MQNKVQLDKRNMSLEKRWNQMKRRAATNTSAQVAFYESMAEKKENDNRRQFFQQMNLERKKR